MSEQDKSQENETPAAEKTVEEQNAEVKHASARRTRRSFVAGAAATAGAAGFYYYLHNARPEEMISAPLRRALNLNAKVSRGVFEDRGLAPTYPLSRATALRVNGDFGLEKDLKPESWRLQVVGVDQPKRFPQYVDDVTAWNYEYEKDDDDDTKDQGPEVKLSPAFLKAFADMKKNNGGRPMRGQDEAGLSDSTLDPGTPGLLLTMDDLRNMQQHELVTQFKCIEGWSQIVQWKGFRLADFMRAYSPARNANGELPKYVYMETPEGNYYTGYTREACEHPQSTLVTEMMGQPLTLEHGAPLRLHMPIKYGYKQIKRIALIAYTDTKPDDYWTKLGYDWYAGL